MKRIFLALLITAFVAIIAYGTAIFSSPEGVSAWYCADAASAVIPGQHPAVLSKHLQAEEWLTGVAGYVSQVLRESRTFIAAGDDEEKEEEPPTPDRIWDVVQYG